MPGKDKSMVIDGFSSVRAVKRIEKKRSGTAKYHSQPQPPPTPTASSITDPLRRFSNTAIPSKNAIICYECGYSFTMPGQIRDTMCPKCHRTLEKKDYTIEGEWTVPLKTLGTVEFTSTSSLKDAEITAREAILRGNIEKGSLIVHGLILICKGARFDINRLRMIDLCVDDGADLTLDRKLVCRNLEVRGRLNTTIYVENSAIIKAGGSLEGEIHATHLIIEEGATMKARIVAGVGQTRNQTSLT